MFRFSWWFSSCRDENIYCEKSYQVLLLYLFAFQINLIGLWSFEINWNRKAVKVKNTWFVFEEMLLRGNKTYSTDVEQSRKRINKVIYKKYTTAASERCSQKAENYNHRSIKWCFQVCVHSKDQQKYNRSIIFSHQLYRQNQNTLFWWTLLSFI